MPTLIKMGKTIGVALAFCLAAVIAYVTLAMPHSYVTTPSMYPTIPPGSVMFIRPDPHPRVGQVIVFRKQGLMWAHRLIGISPNGDILTKGDNPENKPDVFAPPATLADVVGEVYMAPRWLGFPELVFHHPGYGLAWLRTELGVKGRVVVLTMIGLVGLGVSLRRTPDGAATPPQPA